MVVGCWLLVIGYWLLVVGCWLLALLPISNALSPMPLAQCVNSNVRVLKSANVPTCRLTAVISIIERISGIIGNLLYGD
ncbi:hypothetical protein QT970_16755 [Microcoleus sp. herbarium8]|uniref:hypothetical protein n=1 Tax=Microcoleus sp. herbarium8 TaxID=3055436 RepID=UPI002FD5FE7B